MGYKPPLYQDIQLETNELRRKFSDLTNTYLFPPTAQLLEYVDLKIEETYRKKVKMGGRKPDPVRLDQISFIKHVRNDLSEDLSSEKNEERLEAERILMGAVVYRFLRLKENYSPKFEASLKGVARFFASYGYKDVSSCELYNTLMELFKFEKLDPYTVSVCCSSFKKYLDSQEDPTRYAYVKADLEFDTKLSNIIKEATANVESTKISMKKQMEYISFIESMGMSLNKSDCEVATYLEQLTHLIGEKIETLEDSQSLSRKEILESLDTLSPSPVIRQVFEEFIPQELAIMANGEMHTPDNKGDWSSDGQFENVLSKHLKIQSKYTLLGAYFLCLNQCNEDTPDLRAALCTAIGVTISNKLNKQDAEDKETIVKALDYLEKFMRRGVIQEVRFDVWDGDREMNRLLVQLRTSYESEAIARVVI